ncbi:DNA-binding transcriptional LysR family regulator [Lactobacillus colini]|uniref:DNA-binding transcriptional LysR family regulator n=1 Tax=Lactobacillus colini TaxID=1819254 RepID=A0ABS4MB13_9LACO|nr:LysR family transcriptional regulator [Lactobacillus colini]MBP2056868.1 DNA-binding transcriptional LysR family regulator [Lactobacillus colini]
MDIDKLKTFLTIVKYGSFRAAAEKLFLSPRAVSKQINQMESELGVKLFDRKNNRTDITSAGKSFAVTAQDIINTYNNAVTQLKLKENSTIQKLFVGISSPSQVTILQTTLVDFLEKNPQIQLEIKQESGQRLKSLVKNSILDYCITPSYDINDNPQTESLAKIDLYVGELYIGISKINPLSKQESISLSQIKDYKLLYYSPFGSSFLKQTFSAKFSGLLSANQMHPVSTLEQRNLMVALNQGIGLFPSVLKDENEIQNPMINFLPISDDCNKYYSSAIWYNPHNSNPVLKKLIQHIESIKKH